ncbi:hypothetical protein SAMN05192534_10340 [Alteribacillus persepolensis]|uniref:Uncharacterized protein n=1 Tax=Alteribacillus persepolensis TaxID=568899 RepID=A0A1G8AVY9_9BACI|nr:hypothetical protein SAMN05192534_10340 [Alteribacillus persepolensis]
MEIEKPEKQVCSHEMGPAFLLFRNISRYENWA